MNNLINGRVDIIFALAPSEQQLAEAKRLGKELKLTPIGKEAFVFFVNEKNPVKSLTADEIKGIYSGEITNWKEVGGKRRTFVPFNVQKIAVARQPFNILWGTCQLWIRLSRTLRL